MNRSTASSATCLIALMTALSGAVYAQSSPNDDIRESNDPDRAAEVERKAEAISGQTFGGSGETEEERSEERSEGRPPSMPSDEFYGPGEDRSSGESGESEGGSGEREDAVPSPYSPSAPEGSGGSGIEGTEGGSSEGSSGDSTYQGETRDSGPADMTEPYY